MKTRLEHFNWRIAVSVLGIGLAIAALGSDLILGGLSSGIGPLQIVAALVGIVIAILPHLKLSALGGIALSLVSVVVMLGILELALALIGYQPEYNAPPQWDDSVQPDYDVTRTCDDSVGCHWDATILDAICPPESTDRVCAYYNRMGFNSRYEFTSDSLNDADTKILVLGDSFTWGAAADIGNGWVRVMDDQLQSASQATDNVVVWNAAFPGTGTAQAILTAETLIPIMQPDLVILGMHTGNDLTDNLYPVDRFVTVRNSNDVVETVQQYTLDDNFNAVRESEQVIYYRAEGYNVSSNIGTFQRFDNLLVRTRTGTLLAGFVRLLRVQEQEFTRTKTLLNDLDTLITAQDIPFMVVVIPEQDDTSEPTRNYLDGLQALRELDIPTVDTLPLLIRSDFGSDDTSDLHWNNTGHGKAGAFMGDCVARILSGDVSLAGFDVDCR